MNKERRSELEGSRLAFAQGGPDGIRLVLVTPPIKIKQHKGRLEARWDRHVLPFRHSSAPVLVRPGSEETNRTAFTKIEELISRIDRKTWPGKFSSRFRSRCRILEHKAAAQLLKIYSSHKGKRCANYTQALPHPPEHQMSRSARIESYEALLKRASRSCRSSSVASVTVRTKRKTHADNHWLRTQLSERRSAARVEGDERAGGSVIRSAGRRGGPHEWRGGRGPSRRRRRRRRESRPRRYK